MSPFELGQIPDYEKKKPGIHFRFSPQKFKVQVHTYVVFLGSSNLLNSSGGLWGPKICNSYIFLPVTKRCLSVVMICTGKHCFFNEKDKKSCEDLYQT